jgi:hypothetical protein
MLLREVLVSIFSLSAIPLPPRQGAISPRCAARYREQANGFVRNAIAPDSIA